MTSTRSLLTLLGVLTLLSPIACGSDEGSKDGEDNPSENGTGGTPGSDGSGGGTSTGGDASTTGGTDSSPATGGTSTGGTDSSPSTGGTDSSPSTGGTSTGGTDSSSTTGGTSTGGSNSSPSTGGTSTGGSDSSPSAGGTDSESTGGTNSGESGSSAGGSTGTPESGGGPSTGGSGGDTPPAGGVVINELMPSNQTTVADEGGAFPDWIELFNGTDADIDVGGWYIGDDAADPLKASLAAGLVVPAGGVLMLWADGDTDEGSAHLPFKLSAGGESVVLSLSDGTLVDSVEYADASGDTSYARLPNGTGQFAWCTSATPGALNGDSC